MRNYRPILMLAVLTLLTWGTPPGLKVQAEISRAFSSLVYHALGLIGANVVEYRGGLFGPGFRFTLEEHPAALFGFWIALSLGVFWPGPPAKKFLAVVGNLAVACVLNVLFPALSFVIGPHSKKGAVLVLSVVWPLSMLLLGLLRWRAASNREGQAPAATTAPPASGGK